MEIEPPAPQSILIINKLQNPYTILHTKIDENKTLFAVFVS
nr:MAG TPA: hypothetical protein [Caudoviricetes sp.]